LQSEFLFELCLFALGQPFIPDMSRVPRPASVMLTTPMVVGSLHGASCYPVRLGDPKVTIKTQEAGLTLVRNQFGNVPTAISINENCDGNFRCLAGVSLKHGSIYDI
jgi:hypothetical protein